MKYFNEWNEWINCSSNWFIDVLDEKFVSLFHKWINDSLQNNFLEHGMNKSSSGTGSNIYLSYFWIHNLDNGVRERANHPSFILFFFIFTRKSVSSKSWSKKFLLPRILGACRKKKSLYRHQQTSQRFSEQIVQVLYMCISFPIFEARCAMARLN